MAGGFPLIWLYRYQGGMCISRVLKPSERTSQHLFPSTGPNWVSYQRNLRNLCYPGIAAQGCPPILRGVFSPDPPQHGNCNRSLQLHRQVRGPAAAGRGRKREDSDPNPGAGGSLRWPGAGGSSGLLRPGRAVRDDARSQSPLQHLLDQVRKGAQHLRPGGGKLKGAV